MIVAKLQGSFRWSSKGVLLHLVPDLTRTARALCGTGPKGISNGWTEYTGPATCTRCLKRQSAQQRSDQS